MPTKNRNAAATLPFIGVPHKKAPASTYPLFISGVFADMARCAMLRRMSDLLSLPQQKAVLRADMRARRQAHADTHAAFSGKMAQLFLQQVPLKPDAVIAGYRAFRNEADPAFLLEALRARGHAIALPRIVGKKLPLSFYRYEAGDHLVANPIGIMEPVADAALAVEPDVVLVPLLAFDRTYNRLGYGGGFYDKTLMGLRQRKTVMAVGIAYGYQQVEAVPVGIYDIKLDKIATDVNIF